MYCIRLSNAGWFAKREGFYQEVRAYNRRNFRVLRKHYHSELLWFLAWVRIQPDAKWAIQERGFQIWWVWPNDTFVELQVPIYWGCNGRERPATPNGHENTIRMVTAIAEIQYNTMRPDPDSERVIVEDGGGVGAYRALTNSQSCLHRPLLAFFNYMWREG